MFLFDKMLLSLSMYMITHNIKVAFSIKSPYKFISNSGNKFNILFN